MTYADEDNGRFASYAYDALGRRTSQGSPTGGVKTMQYDAGGHLTRLTWPDGLYVTYSYDAAGEMKEVRENGATLLGSYAYDNLGRRTALVGSNGTGAQYGYDAGSRLNVLNIVPAAVGTSMTFGHNPAGQIVSRTSSNDAYAWNGAVNVSRAYTANGLNQYTATGSITPTYDARGNLTGAGGASYSYTARNLLAAAGSNTYSYDALGRLDVEGGTNTRLDNLGGDILAELDGSTGATLRRYVYGPDNAPVLWYEGSGTSDRRTLHTDERGSVIAVTNSAGAALAINSYDEYGILAMSNLGRFQYTGQAWLPTLGMYYYRAILVPFVDA